MYGAIIGDMIGAPYEFDRGNKTKEFPLFSKGSQFTDDSVMTVAVAEALMDSMGQDDEAVKAALVRSMLKWGRKYPNAGYGRKFYDWLREEDPQPYGSWGNGSAMRVSSAGWLFDTLEETRHMARLSAAVSHNHPEGIKGAEATASAIFMARTGSSKEEIKEYIIKEFGYDLSRTCDEIRPGYHHVEACQVTVPEAVTAFMEGNDFEDVVRTAVSLGGDSDTLTDIAASMAEAFYGIPEEIVEECRKRFPEDMLEVVDRFREIVELPDEPMQDPFLIGNERIDEAIESFLKERNEKNLFGVLETIRERMNENGHLLVPIFRDPAGNEEGFAFQTLEGNDKRIWYALFTSNEECEKGPKSEVISGYIDQTLKIPLNGIEGFVINPWSQSFSFSKDLIRLMFEKNDQDPKSIVGKMLKESDLEDGTLLKEAVHKFNENRRIPFLLLMLQLLRDSWVYVPCTAVMSDADNAAFGEKISGATLEDGEIDQDALIGMEFTNEDPVRFIPDILQDETGETYYFPVFTSEEEMGEYGEGFSKVAYPALDAIVLAKNNELDVAGLVINPFTESCVIEKNLFPIIEGMESRLEPIQEK